MGALKTKRRGPVISTITVADMRALADRMTVAGSSRKPIGKSEIAGDLRLAAAVIRMLLAKAAAQDTFRLFAEDEP